MGLPAGKVIASWSQGNPLVVYGGAIAVGFVMEAVDPSEGSN